MNSASKGARKCAVPWWNRNEWCQIGQELFSCDTELRNHALGRILAWTSRTSFKLPKVIECTSFLVRAAVDDAKAVNKNKESHDGADAFDEQRISLSYATALVRFVNLLTESQQSKQFAAPTHVIAQELGLPMWLVDLRHDATHSHMPALPMLRLAAETALTWLKKEYWDDSSDQTTGETSTDQYIQDILVQYQQQQYQSLCGEMKSNSEQKKKKDAPSVVNLLNDLQKLKNEDRKSLVRWLVQPGYLVSTEEQLTALKTSTEGILDNNELPVDLIQFWWPVIKTLHHMASLPFLLDQLSDRLTDDDTLANRITAGWISCLASASAKVEPSNESRSKFILKKADCLPWREVVRKCALEPCKGTRELIKRILACHPDTLDRNEQDRLFMLMDTFMGTSRVTVQDECTTIYTVQDLTSQAHGDADVEMQTAETANPKTDGLVQPWTLSESSIKWHEVPIGGVLGSANATASDLELPQLRLMSGDSLHVTNHSTRAMNISELREKSRPTLQGNDQRNGFSQWPNRDVTWMIDRVQLL